MFGKVKIEPIDDNCHYKVSVNGEEIKHCIGVNFFLGIASFPEVTISTNSVPEYDGDANIEFDFSPESFHDTLEMMWDFLFNEKKEEYQKMYKVAKDVLKDDEKAKSFINTMKVIIGRAI